MSQATRGDIKLAQMYYDIQSFYYNNYDTDDWDTDDWDNSRILEDDFQFVASHIHAERYMMPFKWNLLGEEIDKTYIIENSLFVTCYEYKNFSVKLTQSYNWFRLMKCDEYAQSLRNDESKNSYEIDVIMRQVHDEMRSKLKQKNICIEDVYLNVMTVYIDIIPELTNTNYNNVLRDINNKIDINKKERNNENAIYYVIYKNYKIYKYGHEIMPGSPTHPHVPFDFVKNLFISNQIGLMKYETDKFKIILL